MKMRHSMIVLAGAILAVGLSGCGFGANEPAGQVVVDTPTAAPDPTATPIPEPTVAPNLQDTVYTSSDRTISIKMPDATWGVKADEPKMKSFESPDQGSILILHGLGKEDVDSFMAPRTEDLAVSIETASGLGQGTDFEILSFNASTVGEAEVYSYTVHYMNPEKSGGYAYILQKHFCAPAEYYSLYGSVKDDASLGGIEKSIASFEVLDGGSLLKAAATPVSEEESAAQEETGETAGESSGERTYSDEELKDTEQTRTIYRNSNGDPIVVTPNGDGYWSDSYGNTYRFQNDTDVYDQNDVDFYWHGEAGDVSYMTSEESGEE